MPWCWNWTAITPTSVNRTGDQNAFEPRFPRSWWCMRPKFWTAYATWRTHCTGGSWLRPVGEIPGRLLTGGGNNRFDWLLPSTDPVTDPKSSVPFWVFPQAGCSFVTDTARRGTVASAGRSLDIGRQTFPAVPHQTQAKLRGKGQVSIQVYDVQDEATASTRKKGCVRLNYDIAASSRPPKMES